MRFVNILRFYPFYLGSLSGTAPSNVTHADWKTVIDGVVGQFSVSEIVSTLASIVAAGIGFIFLWWGVRKAFRAIMSAVRKGRMGV